MAEKTEKATPKKLRDARKKGQVAKSQDFPSAFTFIVGIAATMITAPKMYELFTAYMKSAFQAFVHTGDISHKLLATLAQGMNIIMQASIPILIMVVFVGILTNFLVIGPVFSLEAMKPDIKKLNPVTNLKNKFKLKTLVELIKSILKITGAVVIIYFTIYHDLGDIIFTAAIPPAATVSVFKTFLMKVIIRVGIFFIAIAVFDVFYQKLNFAKEMKMEKFEVKQEYKNTEGDPHVKGRRRQLFQEIAYQEGNVGSVKKATAVVSNPTHIACAIQYEEEKHPAPILLIKGIGKIAEIIIKEAEKWNVPVIRNVPLAHELFKKGKANRYIPRETYEAVAEILKWLYSLKEETETL